MSVEGVYGFIGNRYVLAAGAIVQVGPGEGINAVSIKLLSGGTLEIGGFSMTGVGGFSLIAGAADWTGSGGQTFGQCYPISANEIFSGNFSGKMFLYASGATCVVSMSFGRSQGF